jgi:hypothetical protein
MPSVIIDRLSAAVDGAAVLRTGGGLVRLTPTAGIDNLTVTASPSITEWVIDQAFLMRPNATNTGAMTVTHAAAGQVALKTPSGAALAAGQVQAGLDIMMTYDGTDLRIVGSGF